MTLTCLSHGGQLIDVRHTAVGAVPSRDAAERGTGQWVLHTDPRELATASQVIYGADLWDTIRRVEAHCQRVVGPQFTVRVEQSAPGLAPYLQYGDDPADCLTTRGIMVTVYEVDEAAVKEEGHVNRLWFWSLSRIYFQEQRIVNLIGPDAAVGLVESVVAKAREWEQELRTPRGSRKRQWFWNSSFVPLPADSIRAVTEAVEPITAASGNRIRLQTSHNKVLLAVVPHWRSKNAAPKPSKPKMERFYPWGFVDGVATICAQLRSKAVSQAARRLSATLPASAKDQLCLLLLLLSHKELRAEVFRSPKFQEYAKRHQQCIASGNKTLRGLSVSTIRDEQRVELIKALEECWRLQKKGRRIATSVPKVPATPKAAGRGGRQRKAATTVDSVGRGRAKVKRAPKGARAKPR